MNKEILKKFNLLYVEDEQSIRKYAISYFNRIFAKTFEAKNAQEAINIYKKEKPHIVVTDIKMGKVSGLDLIREIRKEDENCQIIVLSAFLDTKYLLDAVELNLVKYLTKPINPDEIYAALLTCAKNLNKNKLNEVYFSDNSSYNPLNKILILENNIINTTSKEQNLLNILCIGENRIVTYQEIESEVWFDSEMSDNALRVLIKKLRKKLPSNALENIAKVGYKINLKKL
jgi:DNA-binding response OmpR family regulator